MAFHLVTHDGGQFYPLFSDDSGWLTYQTSSKHYRVEFEVYKYKGVNYLKINQPGTEWHEKYLSVNKNGYLGLYAWSGASGWSLSSSEHLISAYNGQIVGMNDGFYQAASNARLVKFHKVDNPGLYAGLS